jgi:1,4-alpha-glucan branching enzyme
MSIKKTELKNKKCKVNFKVTADIAKNFTTASLVGDFNNWDATKNKMKKLKKDGSFSLQRTFEMGKEYQFKYLLDGEKWVYENDSDKLVATEFNDSQNSVIVL